MTEEVEQAVRSYQQAILEAIAHIDPNNYWDQEVPELASRFNTLAQNDRTLFRKLCVRLLDDDQREVRLGTIKLINSSKIKDNVLSMLLVTLALNQEDLRQDALYALWRVRTRRVLPQILLFADKGYSSALYMARPMLQTPEEIERGIAIARKYIAAKDYELREAALFLLQKHSTMRGEAGRVLEAVYKYTDELFINALKEAPPEIVLEPLKVLRSRFPERSAEYGDLSSTITMLEQKKKEVDEQERKE